MGEVRTGPLPFTAGRKCLAAKSATFTPRAGRERDAQATAAIMLLLAVTGRSGIHRKSFAWGKADVRSGRSAGDANSAVLRKISTS